MFIAAGGVTAVLAEIDKARCGEFDTYGLLPDWVDTYLPIISLVALLGATAPVIYAVAQFNTTRKLLGQPLLDRTVVLETHEKSLERLRQVTVSNVVGAISIWSVDGLVQLIDSYGYDIGFLEICALYTVTCVLLLGATSAIQAFWQSISN